MRRSAKLGGILPSNADIARELDVDEKAASYRINKIAKAGRFRVISDGPMKPRRIEMVMGTIKSSTPELKARRYD